MRALRVVRRSLREIGRALLDAAMPPSCAGCGAAAAGLCRPCRQGLQRRPVPGCRRCGEPTVGPASCAASHRDLRNLAFLSAPFRFAGTGGALVRRYKLDADPAAGHLLARAMRQHWRACCPAGWQRAALVSVPLHRQRRRARGFDQAAWLARQMALPRGLSPLEGALRRTRPTRAQGDPRTTSRAGNVAGAFEVALPERLTGRRIVLVDDVFTSGATMRECARVLLEGGASAVAGLVACRS